jgi:ABC-2 type transport system permease protein
MKDQITSETRKLLSTRSVWGLLGGAVLVSVLAAWAIVANIDLVGPIGLAALPGFQEMMALVPAFVLVLGIRSYTDEARHGSLVPTLLSSPARRRIVAAKVVVIGLAAVAFAIAAFVAVIAVATLILSIDGVAVTIGSVGALAALVTKVAGVCVLWATIGVGIGMIVSHQVAAIVGSLMWLFAVENLLDALAPNVARFLPGHVGMSALGLPAYDGVAPFTAAGLLAGWAAACLVVGASRFERRDIG